MAEQNILAGDVRIVDQMLHDINDHMENIERLDGVEEKIKHLTKQIDAIEAVVKNEIDTRIKDSEIAICEGFDKSINSDRNKIKEVQAKREKAKSAGVKERISNETADIKQNNIDLRNQIKEMFANENIPMICNSRLYLALFRTKKVADFAIYFLYLVILFGVIPGCSMFIEGFPIWGLIIYYFIVVLFQNVISKIIVEKTVAMHGETIDAARKIRDSINVNNKKVKKISKKIKTDENEDMYDLAKYDDRILELKSNIERVEKEKENALDDFERGAKEDNIAEIEARERDNINAMKDELKKNEDEHIRLDNLIKKQRIYISSNYEAYLGKEYATIEKLNDIKQIMKEQNIETVGQALAVCKERRS